MTRELAHEPSGWRTMTLLVTVCRYTCTDCGHIWRHNRRGDTSVTVIIDLTPVRDKTGLSRQLDMVAGRSKQASKNWPCERRRSGATV